MNKFGAYNKQQKQQHARGRYRVEKLMNFCRQKIGRKKKKSFLFILVLNNLVIFNIYTIKVLEDEREG